MKDQELSQKDAEEPQQAPARPYQPPRVESVRLDDEAAEALT